MKTYPHPRSARHGFTLIELLTVIAIIGILAGILIPVVGAARTAANKTKTKTQFNQYALALQQYRTEYGYWPAIGTLNSGAEFNLSSGTNSADFILALTGRNPGTGALDNSKNRKAAAFLSISDNELRENTDDVIVDAFDNPNIIIKVDHDNNGKITGLPNSSGSGTGETINAKVAIWSVPNKALGYEYVQSWN